MACGNCRQVGLDAALAGFQVALRQRAAALAQRGDFALHLNGASTMTGTESWWPAWSAPGPAWPRWRGFRPGPALRPGPAGERGTPARPSIAARRVLCQSSMRQRCGCRRPGRGRTAPGPSFWAGRQPRCPSAGDGHVARRRGPAPGPPGSGSQQARQGGQHGGVGGAQRQAGHVHPGAVSGRRQQPGRFRRARPTAGATGAGIRARCAHGPAADQACRRA